MTGRLTYLQALQCVSLGSKSCRSTITAKPTTQQPTSEPADAVQVNPIGFLHLPLNLQTLVLAWAGSPLTTCTAAAHISDDAQLVAQWLQGKKQLPLLVAAKHGRWDVCQHLLDTQPAPSIVVACAAVQMAAEAGNDQMVHRFLHCAEEPLHRVYTEADGCSMERSALQQALKLAAINGHTNVCHVLTSSIPELVDAEPYPAMNAAMTAISAAVEHGQVEVVCFLLDAITQRSPDQQKAWAREQSALSTAAGKGQLTVMQALLDRGRGDGAEMRWPQYFCTSSPLAHAIDQGQLGAMQLLIGHGAPLKSDMSWLAWSALAYAAKQNRLDACQVLLTCRDVTVGSRELEGAVIVGNHRIVSLLLQSDAGMMPELKQDQQRRAGCLAQAITKAVQECTQRQRLFLSPSDVLQALLDPPAHWGPVTPEMLVEGVRAATQALNRQYSFSGDAVRAIEQLGKAGADLGVDDGALLKAALSKRNESVVKAIASAGRVNPGLGQAALRGMRGPDTAVLLIRAGVPLESADLCSHLLKMALQCRNTELRDLVVAKAACLH
jgi:hypothetical protein